MKNFKKISVIIPARNEEALIAMTLDAVLVAVEFLAGGMRGDVHLDDTPVEVIVVDNMSVDNTAREVHRYAQRYGVRLMSCLRLKTPCARNEGARNACGEILCFVDADTLVPRDALSRIIRLCGDRPYVAGITRLASLEGGLHAWFWWTFWDYVRRLPLPRAKAMPAFMFCTRRVFDEFGPFDEDVTIGEEWPILAGFYRRYPKDFVYDRRLTALSSSRRMELRRFGYLRTFFKYVWAVLFVQGRRNYSDDIRHPLLKESATHLG
ncbi:MAG: glycosyltransferase [Candidatus Omnitrophota bacterium]|nr:glycosyltransferase [Candidatus Omnitrophota bacterium]MDZ4242512.1 glycosyltransferase [Candidatus Omnitrophota bacterium]